MGYYDRFVTYDEARAWAQRKLEQEKAEKAGERGLFDKVIGWPIDAYRSAALSMAEESLGRRHYGGSIDSLSPAESARNIYNNMQTSAEAREALQRMANHGDVNMSLALRLPQK